METVIHSNDAFAPVAYLNIKKAHLEDKKVIINLGLFLDIGNMVSDYNINTPCVHLLLTRAFIVVNID